MPSTPLDGHRVVLTGHAEPTLIDATEATFKEHGAHVVRADQADLGSSAPLDICICFAFTPSGATLRESRPDELEDSVMQALLVPQRSAMLAVRRMTPDGGTIVFVGGLDATHAYPHRAAAAIAMGGLLGLVRAMAVELSSAGIRANLVLTGPLGDPTGEALSGATTGLPRTLQRSPMGRLGRPAEVAATIRFVAGPDAGFMTGQTIRVDGGWASLHQAPDGMRFS